jgi:serine/threonine protein kinase
VGIAAVHDVEGRRGPFVDAAEVERLTMKPTARRRLGKYVLLGRIGHGGMGKIYLANAPGPAGIDKLLVVKRLHSHLTGDPTLVSNFLDEARLSMALNHPNIVHTYDVDEADGRYFMVMEYIDGQNLGIVLRTAKRSGNYPSSDAWCGLFVSVLDGLHAAHTAKNARGRPLEIIHRDVSPQNILVTYEGVPKLVDFGIAKAALRVHETDAGVLKGKYAYMSPEQVRGEPLDARSDVFAAGIVLWEMLAGRRLYKAESIVRSVERILEEAPISPARVNPECDAELAKVCLKALQKNKEQRFATALEFKNALEDTLRSGGHRFRSSDTRDLMHRLFSDVMARQREIVNACLSDRAEPVAGGDDDDEKTGMRRASDSVSDVRGASSFASSSTSMPPNTSRVPTSTAATPGKVRSPLVSADGGAILDAALNDPTAEGGPTGLEHNDFPDIDARDVVVEAELVEGPSRAAQLTAAEIAQAARTRAIAQKQPMDPRRRAAFVGVFLGVLVVVAAVFVLQQVLPKKDDADSDKSGETTAVTTTIATTIDGGTAVAAAAIDAGAVLDAGPARVDDMPDGDPNHTFDPAVAPPVVHPAPLHISERHDDSVPAPEPKLKAKPDVKAEPKLDRVVEKGLEPVVEVQGGEGFLTLDTVPWTTVYMGKHKLGDTPLVHVAVPAGDLELTLENPGAKLKEMYIAHVKPGETYKTRLDLQ